MIRQINAKDNESTIKIAKTPKAMDIYDSSMEPDYVSRPLPVVPSSPVAIAAPSVLLPKISKTSESYVIKSRYRYNEAYHINDEELVINNPTKTHHAKQAHGNTIENNSTSIGKQKFAASFGKPPAKLSIRKRSSEKKSTTSTGTQTDKRLLLQMTSEAPFFDKLRKIDWHLATFRRLGMFFDDTAIENKPIIDEALRRMPEELWEARNERFIRATMLQLKNEWLPKDQWTKWEDETWYLAPYIHEVRKEMEDYQQYRGRKLWYFSRIFMEKNAH